MSRSRTAGVCAALLLAACPLAAQDVFNSGSVGSPCDQALAREALAHNVKMNALDAKEAPLRKQYEQEQAACHNQSCLTKATDDDSARHRNLELQKGDERARYHKARIDVEHSAACTDPVPAAPLCSHDRAAETRRYSLAISELQKKEVDIRNLYEHEISGCPSSAECKGAPERERASLDDLKRQEAAEGTRRDNAMAAIDKRCGKIGGDGKRTKAPTDLFEINCPDCRCVSLAGSALLVDRIVEDMPLDEYNCFFYVKSFIENQRHHFEPAELLHSETFGDDRYMHEKNFDAVAVGINLGQFKAQIGDIIAVEGDTGITSLYRPWVHVAIVTAVDSAGKILSTRQKPDGGHCVVDLSLSQFYRVYPVQGQHQYRLYRSKERAGTLPRR